MGRSVDAFLWRNYGFSDEEMELWRSHGYSLEDAMRLRDRGMTPCEARCTWPHSEEERGGLVEFTVGEGTDG